MDMPLQPQGYFDLRFEALKDAFVDNFAAGRESGAALCISIAGEVVVDLWAGVTDKEGLETWQQDTLVNVFSCTKGIAAVAMLKLVERGLLKLDVPVCQYWPEFAVNGKEQITIEQLLCHSSGISAIHPPVKDEELFDWPTMVRYIEQETPWWPPGTKHGYAPVVFAWTIGELFRRAAGETMGTFIEREIMQPLSQELYIGVPEALDDRIARILSAPASEVQDTTLPREIMGNPQGVTSRAFINPMSITNSSNKPAWRRTELCSANGHGNARSLATLYDMLANKGCYGSKKLLDETLINSARSEWVSGQDQVLKCSTRYGLGFLLHQEGKLCGLGGAKNFGHQGASGALGFADPQRGIGFGYVCNRMGTEALIDPRAERLVNALYESLNSVCLNTS